MPRRSLEPHMEKSDQGGKGTVVLATVRGDVHDIGKNLVDIILTNNGYQVVNLGIKVPIADMVDAVSEHNADAIGMSGLLVKSTLIMRENLEEMNERGDRAHPGPFRRSRASPAVTSSTICARSTREDLLREGCFRRVAHTRQGYGDRPRRRGRPDLRPRDGKERQSKRRSELEARLPRLPDPRGRRRSPPTTTIFDPPFVGHDSRERNRSRRDCVVLNETALFRNQWGYRPEAERGRTRIQRAHQRRPQVGARQGKSRSTF